ncbi:MAG TPA: carboxypeptidase-like regulatory domain-containing protein [Anaerolineales bacterium]|nr:carboxypeptidase-like regulatory domain-containing protein [Anaerolineales bacterium]
MNMKFLVGVLILVLATCSIYSPTPRGSGIEGQVLIGPMCPVAQQGQECPDGPYQATLTVNNPSGVQIVQVKTDAQGRFKIPLVPGNYILHPESPDGVVSAGDQAVVVETSRFTQLTVHYDSGIR